MPERLLPLFPLGVVLFPRTVLPLHIFEDRYKEMIGAAIRDESEFGVVQAGEKGIVNMGCTATVDKVITRYPDGRMDIHALGRRRFEIHELNDEKDYLRGEVTFFEDDTEDEPPRELRVRAITEFAAIRPLSETQVSVEPAADDPQLSFQIAQVIPDLDFRQMLLATRSETDRLRRFTEYIPVYLLRRKHAAHLKTVAPQNGHARVSFTG